ncbi:hypothetical protein RCL95_09190 [Escherichia marmotae]|nr:hypothetical protein [Escherichia marmotae]MEC9944337.1 hypothetical protein [Escherichia marmotae]MED0056864.1 hypothetical protein [Escherichia marmotae]MED0111980.1 hypothetical protein [Escherichia marmotae]MED0168859.1 hypothetical protein [Escherichia marmotae]
MKKMSSVIMLCMSVFILQGCSDAKHLKKTPVINTNTNTNTNTNADIDIQGVDSEQYQYLKQCVKNASALANLNERYKKTLKEMHFLINEAKSYAASNVSGNVQKTITPLFEYKINYKCNDIEQLLIEEYNRKIQATPVKAQ